MSSAETGNLLCYPELVIYNPCGELMPPHKVQLHLVHKDLDKSRHLVLNTGATTSSQQLIAHR